MNEKMENMVYPERNWKPPKPLLSHYPKDKDHDMVLSAP